MYELHTHPSSDPKGGRSTVRVKREEASTGREISSLIMRQTEEWKR